MGLEIETKHDIFHFREGAKTEATIQFVAPASLGVSSLRSEKVNYSFVEE